MKEISQDESQEVLEQEVLEFDEDTQKGEFLTFGVDDEIYGIEVMYVTEIVGVHKIARVPELPEYIKGIINLRGKIIPIMDVRLRFKKEAKAYTDRTCIVVIDVDGTSIGLIVDSVSEVIFIKDEDIIVPPELSKRGNRFIKGIGKFNGDVKLILDCNKLLYDNESEELANISL